MNMAEFFNYFDKVIPGDYIIWLKYKYSFETEYIYTKEILTHCVDHFEWLNDWNEGQEDIIILGFVPVIGIIDFWDCNILKNIKKEKIK